MALAVTSGCAKTPPAVDFEAKYEPNIGKTYWLLGSIFLCSRPTTGVIDCTSIPAGSKLELDGIERGITSDAHFHVKLEDGRTRYRPCCNIAPKSRAQSHADRHDWVCPNNWLRLIEAFGLIRFGTDVDPMQAAAECKRRGDPRVGMSARQYVILHNGTVTAVETRGRLR
jgi:hypothetical protein